MKKKVIVKGQFGYIKRQRNVEIVKTIAMILVCAGLYTMGLKSTGTNQNLLTIVAVLGCLPMAKFAVNVVVFSKAKGCSADSYNTLQSNGLTPIFYDLYFTQFKKNFQISCLEYKRKNLILFSEDSNIDIKECQAHLETVCKNAGYENITVKVFLELDKFMERLRELNELEEDEKDITFLLDNILNVSI